MIQDQGIPNPLTQLTHQDVYRSRVRVRTHMEELRPNESAASGQRYSIIAIDLGTTTGWATHQENGLIRHGSAAFHAQRSSGRFEGGGMRFLKFRRWLNDLKAGIDKIDAVFFEEVRRHVGVDAAHAYGGYLATLTAWCEHHQIPYQGVPVGTIKKHATGKGNASKSEMIAAIFKRGLTVADNNEADALALLYWVIETGQMEALS